MAAVQGSLLGGEGSLRVQVQVNTGDIAALRRKLSGAAHVINPALWARAHAMADRCAAALNEQAPQGSGGGWRRGSPPLSSSHRGVVLNAYQAVVYSEASHALFIVGGFAPHMPPAEAWIGDQNLSYVMRRAVLQNETPEAPRDYFTPVVNAMDAYNDRTRDSLEQQVAAKLSS